MLRIRLREAMEANRKRTGERWTYETLARVSGLSIPTLQSIAARPHYNATLSTVERLCIALDCAPSDLLELIKDDNGSVI